MGSIGPGDTPRRATKLHSTLVKRRTTSLARLDALLALWVPTLRHCQSTVMRDISSHTRW
jgi:hypothetical protein